MRKLAILISLSFAAFGQTFESASVKLSSTAASSHIVDYPDRFECLYLHCKVFARFGLSHNPAESDRTRLDRLGDD